MPLSPGDKLGSYEILSLLGKGGMGEVYRARDPNLNREVAIKVLPPALANDRDYLTRFQREAQTLASLNHPNIAAIYGLEGNAIVMELVEGETLRGPLPLAEALPLARQIAEALEAAHDKGIIHRDLKPGNIKVTPEGVVKVLDFGLAKSVERPSAGGADSPTLTMRATEAGLILGTAGYMSPEQAAGKPLDRRADIWAFGVVLYEVLTGKRLFDGETVTHTLADVIRAPIDLSGIEDGQARQLIGRCLDRNLKSRLAHIAEARIAIENYAPAQTSAVGLGRAGWWPWAVAAALVLGALGGWEVTRSRQAPAREQAYRFQIDPPEGGQFDSVNGFAVSPDDRTLAFVATAPGKSGLWLRPMDGTAARLLPGTQGALRPFWSPDGRSLAYYASGKLWRIDAAGGSPIVMCDTTTFDGGDWSPDGAVVFASGLGGLRRVSASGGASESLTTPDAGRGEAFHRWPQVLPGGRTLFFVSGKPEVAGIYAASLANLRERVRLTAANSAGVYAAGYLLWLRGSTLVAQPFDPERLMLSGEPRPVADPVGAGRAGGMPVAASSSGLLVHGRAGGSQLTWVDRAGNATGSDKSTLGDRGDYATFRLSPNGRRVVASRGSGNGLDLWMVDVERDAWSRFTFLLGSAGFPVWSPDGGQVMFRVGSPFNLYRKEASGAGAEQRVTESANTQIPTDWSRDGRLVLYYEIAPDTGRDLWVLPATPDGKPEGGAKAGPYLHTRFNERNGRFSPEPRPRWVAYQSDESGREEVYIQGFPEPRGKFQISTGGGNHPEWSPDGRELYYLSSDSKLMAAGVKLGVNSVNVSIPRELFPVAGWDGAAGASPYAVAPDGKRFLVLKPVGGSQPLEVIVNWPALLNKGAVEK